MANFDDDSRLRYLMLADQRKLKVTDLMVREYRIELLQKQLLQV
eukprot:CAMPEP_0176394366 /NCGR_PEP_ID=MMETSP0126-20121128/42512_1 /TAXON_ID=141414 ORGANISM="Strombidinopsis acuminatum, Strain SPMC142" /NCGR_SAMPLE_ID=MMETSP0126 /ASSEMBLY_ACC=CAM_ASM_000229 /LENGTH=43 /DNA_ID= /DNA_START= /DNA_END= /DNA_ORIENTATION=